MSFGEQMQIMLKRKNKSVAELAEILGKTRQNVYRRLKDSNFTEKEMKEYTEAIGCDFSIDIVDKKEQERRDGAEIPTR